MFSPQDANKFEGICTRTGRYARTSHRYARLRERYRVGDRDLLTVI